MRSLLWQIILFMKSDVLFEIIEGILIFCILICLAVAVYCSALVTLGFWNIINS